MIFRSKTHNINSNSININGSEIDLVSNTKFIGVVLDSNLKWDQHINLVKNKISKGIGIICKARKLLDQNTLVTLYYSMIYPYLIYCIEVWGNSAQVYMSSLLKLQKKTIRIITSASYRAESDPLFNNIRF